MQQGAVNEGHIALVEYLLELIQVLPFKAIPIWQIEGQAPIDNITANKP